MMMTHNAKLVKMSGICLQDFMLHSRVGIEEACFSKKYANEANLFGAVEFLVSVFLSASRVNY